MTAGLDAEAGRGIFVGETFSRTLALDAAAISAFAQSTGDTNPLHHDAAFAAATRFGGIIASGSHVSALLLGMLAGHFAGKGTNVGLDFSVRFRAAVPVDQSITMRWTVTERTAKASLKGDIVTLEGEIVLSDGTLAVTGTAHAAIFDD
jgi:acyl dehydratase